MKLFKISVKRSRAGFQLLQEETAGPPAALRSARGPLSPYKLTACAWPLGPSRPTQQPPLARPEHSRAWPRPRFSETRKSRLPYSPGVPAEGSPRATRAPSGWPLSSACAWLLSETWLLRERGGGTKSRVGGGRFLGYKISGRKWLLPPQASGTQHRPTALRVTEATAQRKEMTSALWVCGEGCFTCRLCFSCYLGDRTRPAPWELAPAHWELAPASGVTGFISAKHIPCFATVVTDMKFCESE